MAARGRNEFERQLDKPVVDFCGVPYSEVGTSLEDPRQVYDRLDLFRALERGIESLPEREARILTGHYGYYGDSDSVGTLAAEMELSETRVMQLQDQAQSRLSGLRELSDEYHLVLGIEPDSEPTLKQKLHQKKVKLQKTIGSLKKKTNGRDDWRLEDLEYGLGVVELTQAIVWSSSYREGVVGSDDQVRILLAQLMPQYDLSQRHALLKRIMWGVGSGQAIEASSSANLETWLTQSTNRAVKDAQRYTPGLL